VVRVERDRDAVSGARAGLQQAGLTNVGFMEGNVQTLDGLEGEEVKLPASTMS